ncbi:MAG: AAA family ATPase [Saprospiraceae bacterium]|nr:AAA family ATPase [Saprospiraceae bacterium]
MVIAVTNLKGGVGKTTIATNLAVCFAHRGKKVCIVDTDLSQKSSMDWSGSRDETMAKVAVFGITEKQLNKEVESLRKDFDIVIIDGTPQLAELASRTILASDIVLIPLSPSIYDFRAFESFLEKYEQVRSVKESIGKIEAFVVVNRVNESANVSREIQDALQEYSLKTLQTRIASRVAYVDSATQGLGVFEYKDKKAKEEITRLTDEVAAIIETF